MSRKNSTALVGQEPHEGGGAGAGATPHGPSHGGRGSGEPPRQVARMPHGGGGFFGQYKPEQGIWTRRGTFIGAGVIVAWGAKFVFDQLTVYEGDEAWTVLITHGIPILFAVVLGTIAWRLSFSQRKAGDFMIATEGEMKKVNWSTKKEIVGSTVVVIVFTAFLAVLLFVVDLLFQFIFRSINVLKV